MGAFLIQRTSRAFLTLWFVLTAVFVSTRLTGDPTDFLLPDDASPRARQELRVALGLEEPLLTQYRAYLVSLFEGNLGISFFERRPVTRMLSERIPPTVQLALLSLVLSISVGIPAGIFAALHRNTPLDRALMSLSVTAYAIPNFVLGIGLIFLLSLHLHLLPSSGYGSWQQFVMPAFALGARSAALLARLTRSSVLDAIGQDYVRTARAKGLGEGHVVVKHALRNAFLPILTLLGLELGTIIAGSVVIETVFAWPGVGRLIVEAVQQRDFPVLQVAVVLVAATVVAANFLVDLLYAVVDPRVEVEV